MLRGPPLARFSVVSTCPEPWGGSEELWWRTVCTLRARGHAVDVLKTVVEDDHPRIRHLRELACRVRDLERAPVLRAWHGIGVLVLGRWQLDFMRRHMLVAAAYLKAWRPDLVVISQGQNFDGAHLARVCRTLGLHYVLISQKAADSHWPPDGSRAYTERAHRSARYSIFVSEHNLRLTEDQIGAPLPNALLLRNPVHTRVNGPLPWPAASNGEVRLACVARLNVLEKGQDVLLRVLAQRRWLDRGITIRLYGEGLNREGLVALRDRLGVRNVTFEGQSDDIAHVWRDHHALVLPSRAEGLPLALVEAMMCGRPAIVTDVGGNREVVEDGVTGFVATSPSVVELDAALERAWERRAEWPALGEAAARRIRELVPDDPGTVLADRLVEAAEEARSEARA